MRTPHGFPFIDPPLGPTPIVLGKDKADACQNPTKTSVFTAVPSL
jgi:hypothetical protein